MWDIRYQPGLGLSSKLGDPVPRVEPLRLKWNTDDPCKTAIDTLSKPGLLFQKVTKYHKVGTYLHFREEKTCERVISRFHLAAPQLCRMHGAPQDGKNVQLLYALPGAFFKFSPFLWEWNIFFCWYKSTYVILYTSRYHMYPYFVHFSCLNPHLSWWISVFGGWNAQSWWPWDHGGPKTNPPQWPSWKYRKHCCGSQPGTANFRWF